MELEEAFFLEGRLEDLVLCKLLTDRLLARTNFFSTRMTLNAGTYRVCSSKKPGILAYA